MRKKIVTAILLFLLLFILAVLAYLALLSKWHIATPQSMLDILPGQRVVIEKVVVNSDQDGDGILDLDDIVAGARMEVTNKTRYKDAYYAGGYPPDGEGVCTDVVWRAFENAGYDLKAMIDNDIKNNAKLYPRITGEPDANIDFRRVPNQLIFFKRFGLELANEIRTDDMENLKQWQGGDIVITLEPQHVGILSDRRNKKGVPYVIHNAGFMAREEDCLESWNGLIKGHFRYPKQ